MNMKFSWQGDYTIKGICKSNRLLTKKLPSLYYRARAINLVFFKPSLFFEMSLKFFAHFNSCYDFDLSDVSQKSQS